MTHEKFIEIAIKRAKKAADNGGYPFGAVVVKDDKIIGNSNIERALYDPTAHAEVSAIRDACLNIKSYDLTGAVIYSSCHPCQMCMGAIKWSGIKEIYYAMNQDDAKSIKHFESIFMDDTINIKKNKIKNEPLLDYMKEWYDINS